MGERKKDFKEKRTSECPKIALLGVPYDGTTSGHHGANLAPEAVRDGLNKIETFSPYQDRDSADLALVDLGNLNLSPEFPLEQIREYTSGLFGSRDSLPIFIGGNHSISIPLVQACQAEYPELKVLVLDAHADLREEYLYSRYNHACVSRRIAEIVGWDALKLLGLRSGTREEFALVAEHGLKIDFSPFEMPDFSSIFTNSPVYLSLDLDIFDPAVLPGTGTPEPGGIQYYDFIELVRRLKDLRIVGMDMVELCPPQDASGVSTIVAASCLRELMLSATAAVKS